MPEQPLKLPHPWSLRKLKVSSGSEWALQYHGMDWIAIKEFLPTARTPLDAEMKKFAEDMTPAFDENCGCPCCNINARKMSDENH